MIIYTKEQVQMAIRKCSLKENKTLRYLLKTGRDLLGVENVDQSAKHGTHGTLGHPFITREPVFIRAKGASEEFASPCETTAESHAPSDEREKQVSQLYSPGRLRRHQPRETWKDLLHIIDERSHSLLVTP